ncbi:uncharacterized protein LOC142544784 [Primulina tabacum]|uniref:uncharacterized protein LOC142544784 n=1 Tax=Primulina tabacum TaxID=48773 RepID=UPI003F59A64F
MAANSPQAFKPYRSILAISYHDRDKASIVKFSPDGLLLAVGSNGNPRTFDISPPKLTFLRKFTGHAGRVTDLSFSSDSRFLATCSEDTTIHLWDVSTGSLVRKLSGHNGLVSCVNFNRESNMIASGSFDETVRIWNVDSGACVTVIPVFSGHITGVDFDPSGSMIAACSLDGVCRIWDPVTGNRMTTIKEPEAPPVGSLKFSSDGKFLLIGIMNNTLGLWNMECRRLHRIYHGHSNTTHPISSTFSGQAERYIVSGSEDKCLCIWDVLTGRLVEKFEAHEGPVVSVSCHPTRNMIASAALRDPNTVKIWTRDY